MKTNTVSARPQQSSVPRVPWNPWLGVVFIVVIYYVSQIFSGLLISIYPAAKHWSDAQTTVWLNNSITAQFIYILLAEGFLIGAIYQFVKRYKLNLGVIGLRRPRSRDFAWGLLMVPLYYGLYLVAIGLLSHIHGFNVNQEQQIGFSDAKSAAQLIMAFTSLVILPPLAEEIMVRGFLYSSLKKALPTIYAVVLTSLIFAGAHLPESASGLLWVGAVDTFILSLFLIYLREKTGGLWASITLHAFKNGVAFIALFVLHVR
jgi:membrane protease YdiL (CAAX protease family)